MRLEGFGSIKNLRTTDIDDVKSVSVKLRKRHTLDIQPRKQSTYCKTNQLTCSLRFTSTQAHIILDLHKTRL